MTAGENLGPYTLLAPIGRGGMGEVWKARDTRLNRVVALKTSKAEFSERFEREARAIAALNHPHICQIYDVGDNYIVMEHIEGQPLRGPMPVETALRYGEQILDALAAAHGKGIVHRDLKPANILLGKSGVKLLDFGLAAEIEEAPAGDEATRTIRLTGEHAIVGTLQYISPEQLQGKRADVRSDLFAFGLVLYEMLTGKPAFEADSRASLIATILKDDPPRVSGVVEGGQPGIPPAVDRMIATCLAKDPEERWQTARDLRRELQRVLAEELGAPRLAPAARKDRERIWMIGTAAVTLLCVALAVAYFRKQSPAAAGPVRSSVLADEGGSFVLDPNLGGLALSADGRSLIFGADPGSGPQLFVRALDSLGARKIPATEGSGKPFWAPDGKSIAFFTGGKLQRVGLAGGDPVKLCDCWGFRGGSWNRDGVILFASSTSNGDGRMYRIAGSGGTPAPVTTLDQASGENANYWPEFLPDGNHFLYLSRSSEKERNAIYAGSLSDAPAQKKRVRILASSYAAHFMPGPKGRSGYLFFVDGTTLFAQRFDPDALKLEGERVPVSAEVDLVQTNGYADFQVAPGGMIVYGSGASFLIKLAWQSRGGNARDAPVPADVFGEFDLSPDGRSVLATRFDPLTGSTRTDVFDLEHGVRKALPGGTQPGLSNAVWSPDGREIAYTTPKAIFKISSGGSVAPEKLADTGATLVAWSRDGRWLTFESTSPHGKARCWALPVTGDRKPQLIAAGDFNILSAVLSPDSRWVAYSSDETGSQEVYIQSFPPGKSKLQVSSEGGDLPRWRPDGKELFYVAESGSPGGKASLMAASITVAGDAIQAGASQRLFTWQPGKLAGLGIADQGREFLVPELVKTAGKPLNLVIGWRPPQEK